MSRYEELRSAFTEFCYNGYTITKNGFSFDFSLGEHRFYPSWSFDEKYLSGGYDKEFLHYLVFSLGMVELVSYWKCTCAAKVRVKCGALNQEQIRWWKKLYFNGLGEFFYRNGIKADFADFMTIECSNDEIPHFTPKIDAKGSLIAVGGGKDSIVTMELLRPYMDENLCYIINPRGATLNSAHCAGYGNDRIVGVHRTIDKTLLELNAKGYLNGHTPFSSIVAFSSYIFAYLSGKKYIALSNESSANESNISGTQINHQYSKSTEFESDFREYCHKWLSDIPEYFSLLRPWSEYQIAHKFVQYPQYLNVFQSCNVGSKTDVWCGKCAKCLYVYILLSAFLPDDKLLPVFGSDMLNNPEFEGLFNGLVYENFDKPFECVGTKAEINLALCKACEMRKNKLPYLLEKYVRSGNMNAESLDGFFDENNFVPREFLPLLKTQE